jgi:hypothetical protein
MKFPHVPLCSVERKERENGTEQTGTLPKGLIVQVKKNTGGLLHGSVYDR